MAGGPSRGCTKFTWLGCRLRGQVAPNSKLAGPAESRSAGRIACPPRARLFMKFRGPQAHLNRDRIATPFLCIVGRASHNSKREAPGQAEIGFAGTSSGYGVEYSSNRRK